MLLVCQQRDMSELSDSHLCSQCGPEEDVDHPPPAANFHVYVLKVIRCDFVIFKIIS